jgi:hypothetical protein
MSKIFLGLLLVLSLVAAGCQSKPGSREFIPGKGWIEN